MTWPELAPPLASLVLVVTLTYFVPAGTDGGVAHAGRFGPVPQTVVDVGLAIVGVVVGVAERLRCHATTRRGTVLGHRESTGVGTVLQGPPLLIERRDVNGESDEAQQEHHHQCDEDRHGAPLVLSRAPYNPHRMTPVAVRLIEPDGTSGVSEGRL